MVMSACSLVQDQQSKGLSIGLYVYNLHLVTVSVKADYNTDSQVDTLIVMKSLCLSLEGTDER